MCQVSVIIPNYNHAQFLPKRLESIFNQTFKDYEVILLDDCSTDNSIEIIEQYRYNPKVSAIIFNDQNSGSTFKQWEKGIRAAKGEFIWIAESDDYCEDVLLETLVNKLKEFPNAGIAYCQSVIVDLENQIIGNCIEQTQIFSPNIWNKSFCMPGTLAIQKLFPYCNIIPNTSAVLFRKAIYSLTNGFEIDMKLNGDWFFWIKMLEKSDIVFEMSNLNYFRQHQTKVTTIKGLKFSSVIERYKLHNYQKRIGLSNQVKADVTKNLLVMLFVQIRHSNFSENISFIPRAVSLLHKFNPSFMLYVFPTIWYLFSKRVLGIKEWIKPVSINENELNIIYM